MLHHAANAADEDVAEYERNAAEAKNAWASPRCRVSGDLSWRCRGLPPDFGLLRQVTGADALTRSLLGEAASRTRQTGIQ